MNKIVKIEMLGEINYNWEGVMKLIVKSKMLDKINYNW